MSVKFSWMSELCFDPDTSDVRLVFKDDERELMFPGHSSVLKQKGHVFKEMLGDSVKDDSTEEEVFFEGVSTKIAHSFIRFLYLREFPDCSAFRLIELIEAGDKYNLQDLIQYCHKKLATSTNLNLDNVFEVFGQLSRLKSIVPDGSSKACLKLMAKAFEVVVSTGMHLDMETNQLRKLMSSEYLIVSSELTCIKALLDWSRRRCEEKSEKLCKERLVELIDPFKDCVVWDRVDVEELKKFQDFTDILIDVKKDGGNSSSAVKARKSWVHNLSGLNYHTVDCGGSHWYTYRNELFRRNGIAESLDVLTIEVSKKIILLGFDMSFPSTSCKAVVKTDSGDLKVTVTPHSTTITPTVIEDRCRLIIQYRACYTINKEKQKSAVSNNTESGVCFKINNIAGLYCRLFFIPL